MARKQTKQNKQQHKTNKGFTFELCAGLCDKDGKSPAETASEEVEEECGFRLPAAALTPIGSAISSSGTTGSEHYMFFGAVDDAARVGAGGGVEGHGEAIEVLALPFESAPAFVLDGSQPKSPGLMFGLTWAREQLLSGALPGRGGASAGKGGGGLETEALELKPVLPS